MANIKKSSGSVVRSRTNANDMGSIQISEDVIAAVVRKYTLSVPGVARLVGQSIVGGLAGIIGKKVTDRAIKVEMDGRNVTITINIVVHFGEHVPTVATNVQNVVRKYVEELTGQVVSRVNVVVQNLEMDELAESDDEEDEDDRD